MAEVDDYEQQEEILNSFEPDEENEVIDNENAQSNITAKDFDPERVLYMIKKSLMGFERRGDYWVRVSEPLARSEFILLYVNSLRSLINFNNLFSPITPDEASLEILETLKEMTYSAVDYGVKEEHIETLINMYDTLKNSFYGIRINGRGIENIKQVLISVYKDVGDAQNLGKGKEGLINWDMVDKHLK